MIKQYRKDLILLLLGLGIGIGAGLILVLGVNEETRDSLMNMFNVEANPVIGSSAPDFELTSLQDEQVSLSEYAGKAVMINFWATWCTPCRLEMPLIEKYQQRYPSTLVVMAVDFQEPVTDVNIFVNELDLDMLVLLDPDLAVGTLYKVQGLPTSFFIDRSGKIRAIHIGSLTEDQLVGYLKKIGVEQ